jgi:hypothetical protein
MHVEHVKAVVINRNPRRVKHYRRPPSARNLAAVGGDGIWQPDDIIVPVGT